MSGDVWVDRTIIQSLANQLIDRWPDFETSRSQNHLSGKERQILSGVVQGYSNRKIGTTLGLSESAVKNSLQHMFAITGVRSRSQLVRMALQGSFGDVADTMAPKD